MAKTPTKKKVSIKKKRYTPKSPVKSYRTRAVGNVKKTGAVYVVSPGESLSTIAKDVLGNEIYWHNIYQLNRRYIRSPNYLHVGQRLILPSRGSLKPVRTYTPKYRLGYYRSITTNEVENDTVDLRDNLAPLVIGYYITNNEYPNYVQHPRRFASHLMPRGNVNRNTPLAFTERDNQTEGLP